MNWPSSVRDPSRGLGWALLLSVLGAAAPAAAEDQAPRVLSVPRVDRPLALEDFLEMGPPAQLAPRLARIAGFTQRTPQDGAPATERTDVYLAYDSQQLYVVFVAFDARPERVRAHVSRREEISGDDNVELILDTFHDRRRAYSFGVNALGVQIDSLWTEGTGYDDSFDTLWHSRGKLTRQGYIVWIAVPFRSLRFPPAPQQTWGLEVSRFIQHKSEDTYWPPRSLRVEGRLDQAAIMNGLTGISPGRNIQLIPYAANRAYRALDERDPLAPRFVGESAQADVGLDAKVVLKDRLVLDATLNPDFGQVESDEPQVTVNRRFEVFFPEKRPFFIENASYFETPINLLFTRRIADPRLGLRATGKLGAYALGVLLVDDQAPGKSVPAVDPRAGSRATFGVFRLNRDVFRQSSVGVFFSDRSYEGGFNRLGGLDARLKLGANWVTRLQGVASEAREADGSSSSGPAYDAQLKRAGHRFNYDLQFHDRSPGFVTQAGFVNRTGVRELTQQAGYSVRPASRSRWLISWTPHLDGSFVADHARTRLDASLHPRLSVEMVRGTNLSAGYRTLRERLRPADFPALAADQDFSSHLWGLSASSSYFRTVSFRAEASWGRAVNFVPPPGQGPFLADSFGGSFNLTLRPSAGLRLEATYLVDRLRDGDASVFTDHIVRAKGSYQFTRPLSLRAIVEHRSLVTNRQLTSLLTTRNFNADLLLTYLLHPGTAVYLGYNTNLQNLDPALVLLPEGLARTRSGLINDGRQIFVKVSYLLRF